MDTKWKKSKAVCGFLSFALGVSFLLSSLLPLAGGLVSDGGRQRLLNALKGDFQETSTFRSYLSDAMNNFIAMGAGGPINGSYYSYSYYEQTDDILETTIVYAVAEGEASYFGTDVYTGGQQPTEADRERWKKEAEAWARQFQDDENILYYITVNSQVVYTNMEQRGNAVPSFPEQGYSFRLSFLGSKCEAVKNDVKLDLYGDGVYSEDGSHWALPGYSNYQAGDGAEGVRVHLAVADSPRLYLKANYSSGWLQQYSYNRYYWHYQRWLENRQELVVRGGLLTLAGLALLLVYYRLRQEKALADRALAKATGHILFEFKLLLMLMAAVLLFLPLTEDMRYLLWEAAYALTIEDGGYMPTWFLGQYLYEVIQQPATILTAFWTCYLFVNDLRYGDKPWRHGLYGILRARELTLPIQKRLSRAAAISVLLVLLALATALPAAYILMVYIRNGGSSFVSGYLIFAALVVLLCLGWLAFLVRRSLALARDLGALAGQISAVRSGDYTPSPLPDDSDLGRASQEVADIQQGMARAVEEQTRSERMKVELVTNVSHDIKTPLTSIISYAELLKQENLEPPAGEYVDILAQKAERLRAMVLDVFEVSKAASGELPVKPERLDLAKLLRQTTADMAEAIGAAPVTLRQALPEEPVIIVADGDRLYRVFQNLLQNALQYALEGSRVYLTLGVRDGTAEVSLKNTSKNELPDGVDFTERFVRGDQSRTDGGSGLGLAIADSFTRACGGELRVEPVADLFVVRVTFPVEDGEGNI